jgi:hypothetical protein
LMNVPPHDDSFAFSPTPFCFCMLVCFCLHGCMLHSISANGPDIELAVFLHQMMP